MIKWTKDYWKSEGCRGDATVLKQKEDEQEA